MLKSWAVQPAVEEEATLRVYADRPMLMNMKKFEFKHFFECCLNVCVLDGVWLCISGGTEESPEYTLTEYKRSYGNTEAFWERLVTKKSYPSWTAAYKEFKHRVVFLEKFYKANGIDRKRVGIGF